MRLKMKNTPEHIRSSTCFIDTSARPRGRRGRLSLPDKEKLLKDYAAGRPTDDIADRFDVDEIYIRKLASRYRVRRGQAAPIPAPAGQLHAPRRPDHRSAFKRARRGFDLPAELEPQYIRLLVAGLSRQQAARKLGVSTHLKGFE